MQTVGNIGFIGGGNMGGALVKGLLNQGHAPSQLQIADPNEALISHFRQLGVTVTSDNASLAATVDILVLAVKPLFMQQVVHEIASVIRPSTLCISIAAGITTSQIYRWLNNPQISVIRAMPNTPALLGQGISGLYAPAHVSQTHQQQAEQLLLAVGQIQWVNDETLLDIITALSGSGPAYFFYMMESMMNAAVTLGLPKEIASKLTLYTALGSAHMALESGDEMAALREKVTSPGGTTQEGIKVLKDAKLEALWLKTLAAAANRSKALSEQFD